MIAALREISLQFLHFLLVWKSPLYLSFALSHYLKDVLLMHFPMKIYVLTTIEGRDTFPHQLHAANSSNVPIKKLWLVNFAM